MSVEAVIAVLLYTAKPTYLCCCSVIELPFPDKPVTFLSVCICAIVMAEDLRLQGLEAGLFSLWD